MCRGCHIPPKGIPGGWAQPAAEPARRGHLAHTPEPTRGAAHVAPTRDAFIFTLGACCIYIGCISYLHWVYFVFTLGVGRRRDVKTGGGVTGSTKTGCGDGCKESAGKQAAVWEKIRTFERPYGGIAPAPRKFARGNATLHNHATHRPPHAPQTAGRHRPARLKKPE